MDQIKVLLTIDSTRFCEKKVEWYRASTRA